MAGRNSNQEFLNDTLKFIVALLAENNITDWFIGYGTLLGIIRNDSCIDGDDDIDIIMNKSNYEVLKMLLINEGFEIEYGYGINKSTDILKTKGTVMYSTIDFYMATVDDEGNFFDKWENVVWSNCYNHGKNLLLRKWSGLNLYIPLNYETKLINRYGESWRKPQYSKGVSPRKPVL